MVSIFVRISTGEKINIDIDLQKTIKDLKDELASLRNVESELITLVFKDIIEGSIIHMVVMKKKGENNNKPKVQSPVVPEPTTPVEPVPKPSTPVSSNPRPSFPTTTAPKPRLFSPPKPSLGENGLNNGLMSMFKSNPDLFINMLKADPGFRNVLEKNPQMETVLNDPATIDMLLDTMSNPESTRDLMRQSDAMMNQINEIPGGSQMLERVMSQYYEPLDRKRDQDTASRPTNISSEASTQTVVPNLWGTPSTSTPNLWGTPSTSTSSTTSSSVPNLTSPQTNLPNSDLNGNLEDNMMLKFAQNNPELISQFLQMSPEYQQIAQSNPAMAEMLKSPQLLKEVLSPENIRLAQSLQSLGGMGGDNLFGNTGGFGGMPNFGMQPQQLSSDEIRTRYATAVQQIEDMGFTIDDNVLQTLHRFNGNVEMTINFLIQ